MSKLYLITGFLGAGKTTFLKQLLSAFGGKKISLIINEFGREGIDGKLLDDNSRDLFEVNNGSIFCACRLEQFAAAISDAQATKSEYIIVEASGLSDPTNIEKILSRDNFSDISYGGSICIVDPINIFKVFLTAGVCKKQLMSADMVVINKADLADDTQIKAALKLIKETAPNAEIFSTSYGDVTDDLKESILALSPLRHAGGGIITKDVSLRKLSVKINVNAQKDDIFGFVKEIINETYRLKGFIKLDNKTYLFDCVSNDFKAEIFDGNITGDEGLQYLVVLSGSGLSTEKAIKQAMNKYPGVVERIE